MRKAPILVKPGRPRKVQMNHVHFKDIVQQYQLPLGESHDAWLARFGLWKEAPFHDELWDGDMGTFRLSPLTKAELAKANKEHWWKQHFPTSIMVYSAFKRKKRPDVPERDLAKINEQYVQESVVEGVSEVEKAKLIEAYREEVLEQPDTAKKAETPKSIRLRTRESAKRATRSRREEELSHQIDQMLSDEPKKPTHLLNRDLLKKKTMLVQEFLKENGKMATPEEVEKELQRRAVLQEAKRVGIEQRARKTMDFEQREYDEDEDEDEEKEADEDERGRTYHAVRSATSGSSFGWELLENLYGIFGQQDEESLTDEERELAEIERFDQKQQILDRIDGLNRVTVPRSQIFQDAQRALVQVYEDLVDFVTNLMFPKKDDE